MCLAEHQPDIEQIWIVQLARALVDAQPPSLGVARVAARQMHRQREDERGPRNVKPSSTKK